MMKTCYTIVIALFVLTLAAACAPAPAGDGDLRPISGKIFRHRWWNHYSRALDAADRQDFSAARADLLAAIARRDKDQRMARTYGMHFTDYFPHRELGVLHWLAGELEDARIELETSIADTPSAKARYYLDRVRKALIEQRGGMLAPPDLTLGLPSAEFRTRQQPVRIKGVVADPHFVARITVDGQALFMQGSRKEVAFDHPLNLDPGRHTVSIEAVNLAGQSTLRKVVVHVDRQGPWVVLTPVHIQGNGWQLRGTLHDPSGVAALFIDGQMVPLTPGRDSGFSVDGLRPSKALGIEARDRLGNTTSIQLTMAELTAARHRPLWVAGLQDGTALAQLAGRRDDLSPVMRLDGWQERQTVYMDQVVITGTVRDRHRVSDILINGESVLPTPGSMVVFSHFVPLKHGLNRITLEARDVFDNTTVRQIVIERKVPRVRLLDSRLRIGVFPFDQAGDVSTASFAFQDNFIFQLLQRKRFRIVERHRLEQILQEQKLNRSSLIQSTTALHLGRLAAAQAIVAGSIVETHTGIEIVGRMVDTETGDMMTAADVYGEAKTLIGFKDLARALALKIHREFPLVDGAVLDKEGDTIVTDLGEDRIRAQRHLIVYHDRSNTSPEGRSPAGMDHRMLGNARVVQLETERSRARLQDGADPAIGTRHRVIVQ